MILEAEVVVLQQILIVLSLILSHEGVVVKLFLILAD